MIKSRRMRWAWHAARIGAKRNTYIYIYIGGKARRKEASRKTKTEVSG
jgi:hypothetical protein